MGELLVRRTARTEHYDWVSQPMRAMDWTVYDLMKSAFREWQVSITRRQELFSAEPSPQELEPLLQDFLRFYESLRSTSTKLDDALDQLRANRESLDREQAEIVQIKREMGLA